MKQEFGGVYIANEKMDKAAAEALLAKGEADAVAFGLWFIANPDLPIRLRKDAPLNPLNADTLYAPDATGYTDYPALAAQA